MVAPLIAMGSRSPSAALSPLPRLYGDSPFSLWAARGPLYPLSAISMVAPLSSMGRVWAALSPLPHLYGTSIDLYAGLHGCSIPSFPISMVPPLMSMESHSPTASLSPLPHLYDTSIYPYGASLPYGRSIPSSPSLWYLH